MPRAQTTSTLSVAPTLAAALTTILISGCHAPPPAQPRTALASPQPPAPAAPTPPAPTPAPPPAPAQPAEPTLPATADLRPTLTALGLTPRPQGARGTCSIFTTCESIEFAYAKLVPTPPRLSPEFVNWAGWQASGGPSDGNFFHNALAGFQKFGACTETDMPYEHAFDPARTPSATALAHAARNRDSLNANTAIRWIVPWQPDRFGVNAEQFAEIKRVLAAGYPVAAGSGHSRLLVGYRDDPAHPAGGVFYTEDSALNRFDEVPYDFVRNHVADVFWIEALPAGTANTPRDGRHDKPSSANP